MLHPLPLELLLLLLLPQEPHVLVQCLKLEAAAVLVALPMHPVLPLRLDEHWEEEE
jgi:hypothetical protein